MNTVTKLLLCTLLLTSASGCAGAFGERVHHLARVPGGGVLRIHGPIVAGTTEAHFEMTQHCQGRWQVLGEREATAFHSTSLVASVTAGAIDPSASDERELTYRCARAEVSAR